VPKVFDLLGRIEELKRRLSDTDRWFHPRAQRVDDLSQRLQSRLSEIRLQANLKLRTAESLLARIRPDRVLELFKVRFATFHRRLIEALKRSQAERLDPLSSISSG
jgi:exonuclease VII large subunit